MIDAVNEALHQLMIRELPVRDNDIDIAFDQPKREWSGRLSRPTLNFFLFDVRQNVHYKNANPGFVATRRADGMVEQQRVAPRVDLNYMITAWATEPEDEHRLLARVFMSLYRNTHIPDDVLPEVLQDQPYPIPVTLVPLTEITRSTEMWGVLDNELRPALTCTLTVALNPFAPTVGPLVRSRVIRLSQRDIPNGEDAPRWAVGGFLHGLSSMGGVRLALVERALPVLLEADGSWSVGRMRVGRYTLEVSVPGETPRQFPIEVPSPSYDVEWS